MDHAEDRSQIVFFDVETIYSTSVIVEFGAIFVCPNTFTELHNYSTLVRPADPSLIPAVFQRSNGINRDSLADAPTFADIADTVYQLLHERIWAGHNILRFDCIHVRKAFSELKRRPPEPKAIVDSLPLLTNTFGRRAGDMKMASLATYFGLGQQTHRYCDKRWNLVQVSSNWRKNLQIHPFLSIIDLSLKSSLDDVRMNLEVIKYCATIMFLESSFPNIFTVNSSWVCPNTAKRNHSNYGKSLLGGGSSDMKTKSISQAADINLAAQQQFFGFPPHILFSPAALSEASDKTSADNLDPQQLFGYPQTQMSSHHQAASSHEVVLQPHEIFISSLTASLVPSYHGTLRIQLLQNGFPFQISCADLKIRFAVNGKFHNNADQPKLNFVVNISQNLCEVLEACDAIALSSFLNSANSSSADWNPIVVTRKEGSFNYPTVRLQIPISECGDAAVFEAKVYKKESSSGNVQRLRFNEVDTRELRSWLKTGNLVDAIFSLDQYEYQQSVGIRLVAKKLIFHK